jgi:hypothetical protein
MEALLTVKVPAIEKVLQDVGECEAAAAPGRGKEVERGANAVRYWVTASQMKSRMEWGFLDPKPALRRAQCELARIGQ